MDDWAAGSRVLDPSPGQNAWGATLDVAGSRLAQVPYVVGTFELSGAHARAPGWLAVGIGFALFLVLYFRGYWKQGIDLLPVVLGFVLLGAVFAPVNFGASVFFIYAAACLGFVGPPRVALRWLLAQPGVHCVIPGARTLEQLEANVGAIDGELTEEELARVKELHQQWRAEGRW